MVGSLVKAAPTTSTNTQDALLAGLDDMGSVKNLREVVAASIAGKLKICVGDFDKRVSLLPI